MDPFYPHANPLPFINIGHQKLRLGHVQFFGKSPLFASLPIEYGACWWKSNSIGGVVSKHILNVSPQKTFIYAETFIVPPLIVHMSHDWSCDVKFY